MTRELTGATALVTGASRGFGRAISTALLDAGARVVGVAHDRAALQELEHLREGFVGVPADAADPAVAGRLLDEHHPTIIVLNAGANPLARPLQHHTWQTFSRNWEVDVAQAFHWAREILLRPVPDATVVTLSSGAAVQGSSLSGGYAGAKATVRFISTYAASEAQRDGLPVRFVVLLPQLTPATALGARAVAAYAGRQGVDVEGFLTARGPVLSPEQVGAAVLTLVTDRGLDHDAYMLTAAGLAPLQ
jgi:NAD(P)-dependent dehydrogenase (short-subunit alcohol dehydrogenase family)